MPLDRDLALAMLREVITGVEDHHGAPARAAAMKVLGRIGDARVVPWLVDAFTDWNDDVREEAGRALVALGAELSLAPLVAALSHEHEWIRSNAASTLGALDAPGAVAPLVRALEREDTWLVHSTLAQALGVLRAREGVAALIGVLDEDRVTWRAAQALALIGDPSALPALARALPKDVGLVSGAIAQFGEVAVSTLEGLLADATDERLRRSLERALADAQAGEARVVAIAGPPPAKLPEGDLVDAFARTRDADVRIAICEALGKARATDAVVTLLATAARADGAWGVRRAAVEALAVVAPETSGDEIAGVLRRERRLPSLREAARAALAKLGDAATPALGVLVADATADAESRAIAAKLLGARAATAPLARVVKERDREVRSAVLAALAMSRAGAEVLGLERWHALLETDDSTAATSAIALLDPGGETLAEVARSGKPGARRAASLALADRGDDAAISVLRELLAARHEANDWSKPVVTPIAADAVIRLVDRHGL